MEVKLYHYTLLSRMSIKIDHDHAIIDVQKHVYVCMGLAA